MNNLWNYMLWAALLCLVNACDKAPVRRQNIPDSGDSLSAGYFICNEGNFQWNNASLSFYNTKSNVLYEDVYKTINKNPVGDILQSVSIFNNTAYLVVNNSGKIEMINPKTFESTGKITGFHSPRFFLGINSDKAYVTDLYDNNIAVVDLKQLKISGKISCSGWTEELLLYGNKVFVTNKKSKYVYAINSSSDQLTDSLQIGYGSQSIKLDAKNNLWVLTDGDVMSGIPPQLHTINPVTFTIIRSFNFKVDAKPIKLMIAPSGNNVYWINSQIYKMGINDILLPSTPWVQTGIRNLYALGYNKSNNEILIADAKDFVQRSEILRYDSTGNFKGSYSGGINSTYFLNK